MCTFDFKIATLFWRHWIKLLQVLQSASQAENLKGNFKKYFVFEITCWNEKTQNLIQNMIWRYGKNPHYGPIKIPGPSWGADDVRIRIYLSFSDPPCLYSERKLLERKKIPPTWGTLLLFLSTVAMAMAMAMAWLAAMNQPTLSGFLLGPFEDLWPTVKKEKC